MATRRKIVDPVNVEVGKRVKYLRLRARMSLQYVGEHLGVTFQQMQKYESGYNRVAPERLTRMAELFHVPVAAFFGETDAGHQIDDVLLAGFNTVRRQELMMLLVKLDDRRLEQRLIDLLKEMR